MTRVCRFKFLNITWYYGIGPPGDLASSRGGPDERGTGDVGAEVGRCIEIHVLDLVLDQVTTCNYFIYLQVANTAEMVFLKTYSRKVGAWGTVKRRSSLY